jgi:hypothetical protein
MSLGTVLVFVITAKCLSTEPNRIRRLWGKEYSEAVSDREQADRLRAGLEKRLLEASQKNKPDQNQIDVETVGVVRAYQKIMRRYPHTEIAAASALSLSGFYQFLGQFDKAAANAEQATKEFAGTREGAKAAFNTGLIHASARHDPAEAIKWFARVSKPAKAAGASYDEEAKLYLSAQQQLLKCELLLGNDAKAKARADKLKQVFPQFAGELDRSYQFEVDSRNSLGESSPTERLSVWRVFFVLLSLSILLGLVQFYLNRRKAKEATS